MAYDETLVDRLRALLVERAGIEEKKMSGGLAFMVNGNMACGVAGETLLIRVGPRDYMAALGELHCRECDLTGRPLKGMVMVDAKGCASDGDLEAWVRRGYRFASSLPAR